MNEQILQKDVPYISVIITAHNRTEYLKNAIQSALNQSLDKHLYEIIVIKNFHDPETDRLIDANGIRNLTAEMNSLVGEDLSNGFENSRGEVLCFLDDDDGFLRDKLKVVYEIFMNDKDVVYYHNSQLVEGGKIARNVFRATFPSAKIINRLKQFSSTIGIGSFFVNLSSVCVRKSHYVNYVKAMKGLTARTDWFFFFVGLDSEGKFYYDDRELTKFTVHESTSQIARDANPREVYFKRKFELGVDYAEATGYISSLMQNKKVRDYLAARKEMELFLTDIYRKKVDPHLFLKFITNSKYYGIRLAAFHLYHTVGDVAVTMLR